MVNVEKDDRISEKHIREVVDTLLNPSSQVDVKNPLLHLTLVEEFLTNPDLPNIANAHEYAIQFIVIDIIGDLFQQQCAGFDISIPFNVLEAKDKPFFQQLNTINSNEFWGLAILYLCYARVDWNYSLNEFLNRANLVDRTARRYRDIAITRLTKSIIQEEWNARIRQRKTRIETQLPNNSRTALIGRDSEFSRIIETIQEHLACTILITGLSGIGKTFLIEKYVHHRLNRDNEEIVDLVWINEPESISEITNYIIDHLSPYHSLISVRELLYLNRTIIVIDGIDKLSDRESIDVLLRDLGSAQVILTSREKVILLGIDLAIRLTGLTLESSRILLQNTVDPVIFKDMVSSQTFYELFRVTDGNPLGLIMGSRQFASGLFLDISQKSLDQIFERLFKSFSQKHQSAWIALALCPSHPFNQTQLLRLVGDDFSQNELNDLIKQHLATLTDDSQFISLVPSAKNYIQVSIIKVHQQWISDIFSKYFQHLETTLDHTFPLSLHILRQLINQKLFGLHESIIFNALAILREKVQSSSDRQLARLWFEIYEDQLLNVAIENRQVKLFHCQLLIRYGKWERAKAELQILIKESGNRGDFKIQSYALMEMSKLSKLSGEYEKAIAILNRIDHFHNLQRIVTPQHLLQKAMIEIDRNRTNNALQILSHIEFNFHADVLRCEVEILNKNFVYALSILEHCFEKVGNNQHQISHLHVLLGRIYEGQGDLESALDQYYIGMSYFADQYEVLNLARVWTNIGIIHFRQEDLEKAVYYFKRAIRVQTALGDKLGLALTQHNSNLLPESWQVSD